MPRRAALTRSLFAASAALLACLAATGSFGASAAPKTVCTVTINSSDEKDAFQRHLPRGDYRFVELVQRGQPDWLASACRSGVSCDALIISGHFDDGTEFYTDRFDDREFLTVHEMQRASCSASCNGLFSQLKAVYLFGCNTLKSAPRHVASAEVARSLVHSGHSQADADRLSELLSERYGQSNRDRLRHVFKDVPVLYGFSSKAPLGRSAGPLLERYFQSAPAGEITSGRASPALLNLFGPSSMIAVAGLTDADPHASFRRDMCGFADERHSDAQKLAFMHEVLQRDVTEVRMFLDHLERYAASVGPAQRLVPEVAAALAAIEGDRRTRERYLAFARDADEAAVQTRMMALARSLGWLSPAQEQAEFLRMIADRMARGGLGRNEVDLVCATQREREPALARQVLATGTVRPGNVMHAAVLACLGSVEAHERTVRALTSSQDEEVAVAQTYLRHRALADVSELRAVASGIGRMTAASAQVRALETLARQRLADAQSLQEIARLFPLARSLEVQRAIAGILIRADYKLLAPADLARSLRQHRLKSPDGNDVIDVLIRLLQSS
ncbi:hypothetical protein HLB44_08905 [Aquincola sp. S2]|uniref:Uncharacterized protein n=1 Tax=Pseudaquabacterium terrae TaxID=2732868 RepID=A0ABX2EEQ1_9BURK|nr:hypothetical protein [Aquabacterium terrae]NRF67098.1 hypothetical protein [Aquabacterium terrae]